MLDIVCVMMQIMDEIQAGLRYMFQTESKYTCLVTGSGAGLPLLRVRLADHPCRQWRAALSSGVYPALSLPAAVFFVVSEVAC